MTDQQTGENRVPTQTIETGLLRDLPQFLSAVVDQNVHSWGSIASIDGAQMSALFAAETAGSPLPTTFVAHAGGRYAGCVSLREKSMGAINHPDSYADCSPWLSNMWVAEWARGMGVATRLTRELEAFARAIGIATIHSSTADEQSLYHRLGYATTSTQMLGGRPIYLISRRL